jgi:hypothetical protein
MKRPGNRASRALPIHWDTAIPAAYLSIGLLNSGHAPSSNDVVHVELSKVQRVQISSAYIIHAKSQHQPTEQ